MTTEAPEYLYHYTNVETLALILENRTIRFNSLDKLDDLEEQETADVKNIGQFYYVSCWTDDDTESIPMWNMYSGLNSGVRLRMKSSPFKQYGYVTMQDTKGNILSLKEYYMPSVQVQLANNYIMAGDGWAGELLFPVEYTNEPEKLYPQIAHYKNDRLQSVGLNRLGKCKNTHWEFQKEWRYILCLLPKDPEHNLETFSEDSWKVYRRVIDGIEKQPFPYYDMPIDDTAFAAMEITLSPRISTGNKLIAETLVHTYNPSAVIRDSDLLGKL